jgi:hypothetical protein
MPNRVQELESFKDFIQNLKLFLLDHLFYKLNEFFKFHQGYGINNQ